jgi:hypothetical protein
MKKVIDGAVYDTSTARELGCTEYSHPGDFHYTCETLYVTRANKYFLHGEGGAMTQYAQSLGGGSFQGSEKIIPLSIDEAKKWAEENLTGDEYESAFGKIVEDDKAYLSLSVSPEAKRRLQELSSQTGKSISAIVSEWAVGMPL